MRTAGQGSRAGGFLEQLQSLFKRTSEPVWVGSVGGELGGATGKEVSAPKRAER